MVIGDALLDVDLDGTARRLCQDAPVPVLDRIHERRRAGGAGLAARFAADISGVDVVLVTALGDDAAGRQLGELAGGYAEVLSMPLSGETSSKTRIRSAGQTLVRVDRGEGRVSDGTLPARIEEVLSHAGTVLVSDYGRGVAAHSRIRRLLGALPDGVPVVWDPHPNGPRPLPGARLVTPNESEARALAGEHPSTEPATNPFTRAAVNSDLLVRHWRVTGVAVTLGANGALLSVGEANPYLAPIPWAEGAVPQVDGCGAGDCFAAAATHVLHGGGTLTEAVTEAVRRSSAFVHAGGVGSLDGTVRTAGSPDLSGGTVWETVRRVRAGGGRVVATGGCFDLLHAGHISLLNAARRLGDCLVLCVNSDTSVRALKGPGRPLVSAADRVRVLTALKCVDAVAVFDEPTPAALLERIRPDLWVKGGDYTGIDLAEADVVRRHGGQTMLLPYMEGRSTSGLLARARERAGVASGGDES